LLGALFAASTPGCGGPDLPDLGRVPPFTLVERAGTPLTAEMLAGHVWVADFVYTRCPQFCPALTAEMARLQPRLATGDDPVRLVSFSVDPTHDTPAVLRSYADQAGAGAAWLFVTGPRDAMAALLRDGFHVAWADGGPPGDPITHSDRFVLVDRRLRIRGYYHGTVREDVERLARDARALQRERSG
jgi:protein SCO1/2